MNTLRMRLRHDEGGMSLAEVMVSMSVFTVVVVIFLSTLTSVQQATVRESSNSVNNDQARLAMLEFDREIRSGNVLYDPATENPAGFVLRIYTQSNANTRTPSPGYVCRVWQITTTGLLQTRSWPPLEPQNASDWVTAGGDRLLAVGSELGERWADREHRPARQRRLRAPSHLDRSHPAVDHRPEHVVRLPGQRLFDPSELEETRC
jgi:type II secretory pathway pseudopilin PulG